MTYNELVKALRDMATYDCGYEEQSDTANEAATRIEQLSRENAVLRNELCERCGRYKMAHEGACDGCRWSKGENT